MKYIIIENEKYIERQDVIKVTGINQTDLYVKLKYEDFPQPHMKEGLMPCKRKLWKLSDVEDYLKTNPKKSKRDNP